MLCLHSLNWYCNGIHLLNGNKSILKGKKAFWEFRLLYIQKTLDLMSLCAIHGDKMKRDGAFLILSTGSELKHQNFFRHMRSHHRFFHFLSLHPSTHFSTHSHFPSLNSMLKSLLASQAHFTGLYTKLH